MTDEIKDPSSLMICKALLENCPLEEQSALLELLPTSLRQTIEAIPSAVLQKEKGQAGDELSHIHYSWLAPFLRTLSESDMRLFLAALKADQVKGLKELLRFTNHLPVLSKPAKRYLRTFLFQQLSSGVELLPVTALPANSFNVLLNLTHHQLMEVILYLGLVDLSFEMRQIISKTQLDEILSVLSDKQAEYVQSLQYTQDPLVFHRLFLKDWDGSKTDLKKLLEERGLKRLAVALHSCNSSFLWYLTHGLEMNLATQLLKGQAKPEHSRERKILTEQVLGVLTFLGHNL